MFFGLTKKFLISVALVFIGLWFFITKVGGVIIPPFSFALIVSYMSATFVEKISRKFGISRGVISMTIVLLLFATLIIFAIVFIPVALRNAMLIKQHLPSIIAKFDAIFIKYLPSQIHESIYSSYSKLEGFIPQVTLHIAQHLNYVSSFVTQVLAFFLITPIVTFYMIKDWNRINNRIVNLLPSKNRQGFVQIRTEIRKKLAGYLSGQVIIIAFLSAFYGIGLWAIGLQFGFTIGVLTGLASIVPYIGIATGVVVAALVAFLNYQSMFTLGFVLAVFACGQVIEGGFLTPRLMSSKINIHPLWIIFGFLTFGVLFGFFGVLFALPLTAIASVLIKFYVENFYQKHYI